MTTQAATPDVIPAEAPVRAMQHGTSATDRNSEHAAGCKSELGDYIIRDTSGTDNDGPGMSSPVMAERDMEQPPPHPDGGGGTVALALAAPAAPRPSPCAQHAASACGHAHARTCIPALGTSGTGDDAADRASITVATPATDIATAHGHTTQRHRRSTRGAAAAAGAPNGTRVTPCPDGLDAATVHAVLYFARSLRCPSHAEAVVRTLFLRENMRAFLQCARTLVRRSACPPHWRMPDAMARPGCVSHAKALEFLETSGLWQAYVLFLGRGDRSHGNMTGAVRSLVLAWARDMWSRDVWGACTADASLAAVAAPGDAPDAAAAAPPPPLQSPWFWLDQQHGDVRAGFSGPTTGTTAHAEANGQMQVQDVADVYHGIAEQYDAGMVNGATQKPSQWAEDGCAAAHGVDYPADGVDTASLVVLPGAACDDAYAAQAHPYDPYFQSLSPFSSWSAGPYTPAWVPPAQGEPTDYSAWPYVHGQWIQSPITYYAYAAPYGGTHEYADPHSYLAPYHHASYLYDRAYMEAPLPPLAHGSHDAAQSYSCISAAGACPPPSSSCAADANATADTVAAATALEAEVKVEAAASPSPPHADAAVRVACSDARERVADAKSSVADAPRCNSTGSVDECVQTVCEHDRARETAHAEADADEDDGGDHAGSAANLPAGQHGGCLVGGAHPPQQESGAVPDAPCGVSSWADDAASSDEGDAACDKPTTREDASRPDAAHLEDAHTAREDAGADGDLVQGTSGARLRCGKRRRGHRGGRRRRARRQQPSERSPVTDRTRPVAYPASPATTLPLPRAQPIYGSVSRGYLASRRPLPEHYPQHCAQQPTGSEKNAQGGAGRSGSGSGSGAPSSPSSASVSSACGVVATQWCRSALAVAAPLSSAWSPPSPVPGPALSRTYAVAVAAPRPTRGDPLDSAPDAVRSPRSAGQRPPSKVAPSGSRVRRRGARGGRRARRRRARSRSGAHTVAADEHTDAGEPEQPGDVPPAPSSEWMGAPPARQPCDCGLTVGVPEPVDHESSACVSDGTGDHGGYERCADDTDRAANENDRAATPTPSQIVSVA